MNIGFTIRSALAVWVAAGLLQAQTVQVTVDAGKMLRPINPLLFGINTARWDESLFPGPTSDMLLSCDRDAIAKIKASGVTLLKYPGGNDADHYTWNSPDNNASEMDTDEYLALCRETGAEPFITVNFNEPPELAAAWVRYCNVEHSYGVKLWEVGDEQWGSWAKGHSTPEGYAEKYIRFVKAMKAVDPTIKVATNVALSGGSPSLGSASGGWTERVLRAAAPYIDLLTITFYPQQWGKENDDTLLASPAIYRRLFLNLRGEVERVVGKEEARRLLFVNVGYNSANHSPGPQTLALVNALWTADMLGTMAETGTDLACYWAVHNAFPPRGGDFGYLSSEGSNTPSYSYYVFPMLTRHTGGELVASTSGDPEVSVYASRAGKRLDLMLINRSKTTAKDLAIELNHFTPKDTASAWILDQERKNEPLPTIRNVASRFSFRLPAFSLVALEMIERDSLLPPQNLARFAVPTASSFSTIGPHFGPASATDGKLYTRWNSAAWTKSNGMESQWFQLAWPGPVAISRVVLRWGESPGTVYEVQISTDGTQWKTVASVSNGTDDVAEFKFPQSQTRFLRVNGTRGTRGISAYSLREIEVYE